MKLKMILALIISLSSIAAETDQFTTLDKDLRDSIDKADFQVNQIIHNVLADSLHTKFSCTDLQRKVFERVDEYRKESDYYWDNFHEEAYPAKNIDVWKYWKSETIYRDIKKFYLGFVLGPLIPKNIQVVRPRTLLSPTINLNGVYLGVDKIAHFFILGHQYLELHLNQKANVQSLLDFGIEDEKGKHGLALVAFSYGDLDANLLGFYFYKNLCEGDSSYLKYENNHWQQRKLFTFKKYVNPYWDETYQLPGYREKHGKIIKNRIAEHCDKLELPQVVERLSNYNKSSYKSHAITYTQTKARDDLKIPKPLSFLDICAQK